jgi:hypothetical protein
MAFKHFYRFFLVWIFCFVSYGSFAQDVQRSKVFGAVVHQNGTPIPGLTVSFFHPIYGRSTPTFTNEMGQYQILNAPIDFQNPYLIEVYWGNQLIYRNSLFINNTIIQLPMIILP